MVLETTLHSKHLSIFFAITLTVRFIVALQILKQCKVLRLQIVWHTQPKRERKPKA